MGVFVIAEAGSSHDNDLDKAKRLIDAAHECGANAVKFQWTSSGYKLAQRRGLFGTAATEMYEKYLEKPNTWLESLKAHADKVGIEFMCTVYLIEDIATIAPLVKRFKVSAYESKWMEFCEAHGPYNREVIASTTGGFNPYPFKYLHCVSKYPTPIDEIRLRDIYNNGCDGLSDHTANVLTGAAAVAAGARIVEAHIRLTDTSKDNPDYPHSLWAGPEKNVEYAFREYVQNIRTVERML